MPRRILLLITDLKIGGTPTVVRELATRLNAPPEVTVDVACLAPRGPVADQLEAACVRVFPLNARGPADWAAIARLARLIRRNRYDTVFSFLVHANVAAAAVRPFAPDVRFIQSIQTTQPNPRWHWLAQSLAHHAADRVVVPSPSTAAVAEAWADVPSTKITIIPNAIDPAQFADLPTPPPPPPSQPIPIGFIGRLDPIKRIPDLLEAVKLLGGRVHAHLYGDGAERPAVERRIAELVLADHVTLHGPVAGPREALAQIRLLVLPSAAEGFGLVLIEAMAAGVPVVATEVPGIRDVVRNGATGLLVPPASPPALADAIAQILDDPALRARLTTAARADVAARFTWDAVIPWYRALLNLPPRPPAPQLSATAATPS